MIRTTPPINGDMVASYTDDTVEAFSARIEYLLGQVRPQDGPFEPYTEAENEFDPPMLTTEEQAEHDRRAAEMASRFEREWNRIHPPLDEDMIALLMAAEDDEDSIIDFSPRTEPPRTVPFWAFNKKGPSKKKRHPKGGLF